MLKQFISMILACYVMFGFFYATEGLARDAVEWLKVFLIYSSTVLLASWITYVVMTIKSEARRNRRRRY